MCTSFSSCSRKSLSLSQSVCSQWGRAIARTKFSSSSICRCCSPLAGIALTTRVGRSARIVLLLGWKASSVIKGLLFLPAEEKKSRWTLRWLFPSNTKSMCARLRRRRVLWLFIGFWMLFDVECLFEFSIKFRNFKTKIYEIFKVWKK